jgi:hypothetical protein
VVGVVSRSINAPDGARWPSPIVAVSQEEQKPFLFGWHGYDKRATDRSIVASDVTDPSSVITRKYGPAAFHLESANLHTGDYWLVGPDGPRDGFVCIERKERDLASSLTTQMPRFKEELERMRSFHNPLIVASCTFEDLMARECPQCAATNPPHAKFCNQCACSVESVSPGPHEAAFIGGISAIATRGRIPFLPLASREMAERVAAWFLIECWQAWLAADPLVLAWAREEERRRGIVREQRRKQRRAG